MSFRGTSVRIRSIEIQGNHLSWRVAFTDDEGVVHGTMDHTLADIPEEIVGSARALVEALVKYSEQIHFEGEQKEQVRGSGIAEALDDFDPFGDPARQG